MLHLEKSKDTNIRWRTHIFFLLRIILIPIAVALLLIEIRIRWYLMTLGIQRSDLSESYGLGFEVLFLIAVSILVCVPAIAFAWWLTVRRKKYKINEVR
jgi:H+/Cl- antiporter ClcA